MKRFALIVLVLLLISTLCGCNQSGNAAPEAATEQVFADTTPIAETTVETVPPYEYRHLYDDQEAMEAAELLCALGLFRATGTDLYARPAFDLEKPSNSQFNAFSTGRSVTIIPPDCKMSISDIFFSEFSRKFSA